MKSRELNTVHNLIATDYILDPIGEGKFRHSFHPKRTDTVYEFIANGAPEVEEGQSYNIGFFIDEEGRNIIDPSCLSKNSEVNPKLSYLFAMEFSKNKGVINKQKNDERVQYDDSQGYYWGPKYAWREYGLVIAQSAFRSYIEEINHPKINCVITNPDNLAQTTNTVAYADVGLKEAISELIESANKVTKAQYKSPLYSKRFSIVGIEAIKDKG